MEQYTPVSYTHLLRLQTSFGVSLDHCLGRCTTFVCRSCHVVCVAGRTVASQFAVDLCTASLGVFVFLQHLSLIHISASPRFTVKEMSRST